ncbi:MAG TPA: succinylglutamate desuccinylase/aspartoacylase family protein [Balneolaceae bacterium]|nr:succinylglutamate desuccinylase/aspartoacylase family protein [Balneolaceae bacterium]
MPKAITVDGQEIGLGEAKEIRLNIARLPTYTPIELSINVFRGKQEGPTLLLTGGIHGNEINGVEIIRQLITKDLITPVKGSIIAIPLVNIYGFIQKQRDLPDGKDINRSFPGSKGGSLARLVANTLMKEIIPHIDFGIDFHTGSDALANYPQIRCMLNNQQNRKLAEAFSAPVTVNSPFIDQSFRQAAQKEGKQILVFETGEAQRFDKSGIREGISGTLRLMKKLGMRSYKVEPAKTDIYKKRTWIRADYAGLFHPQKKLGSKVEKEQVIGHISDPFGREWFKVESSQTGRIIGINKASIIHKGDALMHIAYDKE